MKTLFPSTTAAVVRFQLLLSVSWLVAGSALAQEGPSVPTPTRAASPWSVGLLVGQGRSGYEDAGKYFAFSGGVTAGRFLSRPRLSVQLGGWYEARRVELKWSRDASGTYLYAPASALAPSLFFPLYLRTGTPASAVHFLVGAGPSFALNRPVAAEVLYHQHSFQATGLLGLEVLLGSHKPNARAETTLGLQARLPMTYAYETGAPAQYYQNQQVVTYEARSSAYFWWVGLTLAAAFHPTARP